MQRKPSRKMRALKTTPRKARKKTKSLAVERALDVIGDYLHSLEDGNQRAAIVERLLTLARQFDAKPAPAAKRNLKAKAALVWKDREFDERGPHTFEAARRLSGWRSNHPHYALPTPLVLHDLERVERQSHCRWDLSCKP